MHQRPSTSMISCLRIQNFACVTLSNHPDLEDQLIHLWTEVRDVLRCYQIDDHDAELSSIDTFYHELEYNEMVATDFMF